MRAPKEPVIHGTVSHGFERVRETFIENFTRRNELGAACCVFQDGENVVDLWGGVRDRVSGEPWRENTLTIVHSTTKGLAAMVMALAHQAGLFAFSEKVDRDVLARPDRLAEIMARQRPEWEPGERQAYHAISLGFYEGELIRRVDPAHRSLGQVFAEEIARPLGLEFYIRVPESIPALQIAPLEPPSAWQRLTGLPLSLTLKAMNRRSVVHRSLIANPGTGFYLDAQRVVVRDLEAPSGGGVGNARAIAKAYGVFATGGHELGLRSETLAALMAPASPSRHGFFDECLGGHAEFSLGFMKPTDTFRFGHRGAFGAPGAGGSMGYADPELRIGYGYVTNRMGMNLQGDPRDVALRDALEHVLRRQPECQDSSMEAFGVTDDAMRRCSG